MLLALPLLALNSCSKEETYGLTISVESYTFPAEGGDLTVEVSTGFDGSWNATFDETQQWLTEKARTENSITFTALPNTTHAGMPALKVTFTAGDVIRELTLSQNAAGEAASEYEYIIPQSNIQSVSSNGRWMVFAEVLETGSVRLYRLDVTTDEIAELGNIHDELASADDHSFQNAPAISDDGETVLVGILDEDMYTKNNVFKNGILRLLPNPEGYAETFITDMSADGTVMVGYATNDRWTSVPVKWTNGVPELLDFPDYERAFEENQPNNSGAKAVNVSDDGTIIAGMTIDNAEAFFWKNGEWKWIGGIETEEKPGMIGTRTIYYHSTFPNMISPSNMRMISPDNKYLSVSYQGWGMSIIREDVVSIPGLFNLETEEFEFIDRGILEITLGGGVNNSVTDEGGLFYRTMDRSQDSQQTFYWLDGTIVNAQTFIESQIGGMYVGTNLRISRFTREPFLIVGEFQKSADAGAGVVPFYVRKRLDTPAE